MEMYILNSAACLAVLLLFYKLFLERENMHVFKRFYLLTSVVASMVIPIITFTTYVEPASEVLSQVFISSEASSEVAATKIDLSYIFFGIYLLGVLFFSIKFFRNLRSLVIKIRTNPKLRSNSFINVLLSEKIQPHTFFSYIFFNKENYMQDEIPQDVKIHEQAHARQKHSLDVVFVELLQIIFWFNPLIFLLKDAVKLNHEFLADRAVIQKGISTSVYQQTLLAYSSGDLQSDLVNPINYSSIKKRFTVMKTKTSKKTIWARSLLLLPLAAGLLYGFSTKEVVIKEVIDSSPIFMSNEILELTVDEQGQIFMNNKKVSLSKIENIDWEKYTDYSINAAANAPKAIIQELVELIMAKRTEKEGKVTVCTYGDSDGKENVLNDIFQQVSQEKATPEMVAEYNKLVKYYNSIPKDKRKVKQVDANRVMAILSRMTPEQKAKAEKINFDVPPPPPPAPAPKAEMNSEKIPPSPPPPPAPEAVPFKWIKNVPPPPPPASALEKSVDVPQPPTPPAPPSFEELVKRGAVFYYNGKQIKPEEAKKLVEVEKKVNVQILDYDGKPEVRLSDKEK